MNKFELVSVEEYQKVVDADIIEDVAVSDYREYDELKIPRRATKGSAGYDFVSPISFTLRPGQTMKVPTFVKCSLNAGNVLLLFPRSSYGFKYRMQLDNTVGVVDQDYYNNESNEGHIFIKVTNDSKSYNPMTVNAGDTFAQGIIMPFAVTDDDNADGVRIGGIGSTDTKK